MKKRKSEKTYTLECLNCGLVFDRDNWLQDCESCGHQDLDILEVKEKENAE